MIIDAKTDYKNRKLLLIKSDGDVEEKNLNPAYFYAILPKGKTGVLERVLGGEDAWVESTTFIPVIYKGERYEPDPRYEVVKVCSTSPALIPKLSESLRSLGIRISASNLKYTIRNIFDHNIHFFDTVPLYYGFDPTVMKNIKKAKGLVIDVEAIGGNPILVSLYWYSPFEEVQADDVVSLDLPKEIDTLIKEMNKAPLIIGHNIIGFDLPILKRSGVHIDTLTKSLFDTSVLLSVYGSSLKVGSVRSLLDVATILAKDAGITEKEIEIKKKVKGRIDGLSRDDLVKYNKNDVIITAKLLNIFYPFSAVVSALTQVPISEVITLPSGMVAEYFLLRYIELLGYVPEYRPSSVSLTGERVWLKSEGVEYRNVVQTDVKAMYPNYVLKNYIDPTLRIGNEKFDRNSGIGLLYSAVSRLYKVRQFSKRLKKQNKLYEPLDAGIKAILNALAYGVQGKQSGLGIMGNPWCPSKIFYGTREAQFSAIDYLRRKGYNVIYSDTDSFFVSLNCKEGGDECRKLIDQLVQDINSFLRKYGLEVDVEDIWDSMYIYRKKNYILRNPGILVIKGSALHNLDKFYTPECVNLSEIFQTNDKKERERIIKESIYSAPIEDLFVRGHQQIWRLIGKDVQSWKRLRNRKNRYIRVLTLWQEKPLIVLKKARGGQLLQPHTAPLMALFIENGNEVQLGKLNPFNIIELRTLKVDGELRRIKAKYQVGDALIFTDRVYSVNLKDIYYGIRTGGKIKYFNMWYSGTYPERPIGVLETLKGEIKIAPVNVDEDVLRTCVFLEVKKTLRQYGLL